MKKRQLFRREVLEKHRNTNYGSVFINLPINYFVISAIMMVFLVIIIVFITFAEISEKYSVQGYINEKEKVLIAELFIPVEKSGFLKKGQQVIITYEAYRHDRFGIHHAQISEIDEKILTDDEGKNPIKVGVQYYHVKAKLESPYIYVYGDPKKVQQGMLFKAVIVGQKKKIWQWIVDPVYSFYRRMD